MKLYRCTICGEVYAGSEKPSHCPFCGAHEGLMVDAKDYVEKNIGQNISEKSKEYLRKTLELEISNSRFYRGISKKSQNMEIASLFKYLAKIEKEHADVACKLMGIEVPDEVLGMDECSEDDRENVEESLRREERATKLYTEFLKDVPEKRLKDLFTALIQIESDHIGLDKEELERL